MCVRSCEIKQPWGCQDGLQTVVQYTNMARRLRAKGLIPRAIRRAQDVGHRMLDPFGSLGIPWNSQGSKDAKIAFAIHVVLKTFFITCIQQLQDYSRHVVG